MAVAARGRRGRAAVVGGAALIGDIDGTRALLDDSAIDTTNPVRRHGRRQQRVRRGPARRAGAGAARRRSATPARWPARSPTPRPATRWPARRSRSPARRAHRHHRRGRHLLDAGWTAGELHISPWRRTATSRKTVRRDRRRRQMTIRMTSRWPRWPTVIGRRRGPRRLRPRWPPYAKASSRTRRPTRHQPDERPLHASRCRPMRRTDVTFTPITRALCGGRTEDVVVGGPRCDHP